MQERRPTSWARASSMAILAFLLLAAQPASAYGIAVPTAGDDLPRITSAHAVVVWGEDRIEVHTAASVDAEGAFAWLVPHAADVAGELVESAPGALSALEEATRPAVRLGVEETSGGGCGEATIQSVEATDVETGPGPLPGGEEVALEGAELVTTGTPKKHLEWLEEGGYQADEAVEAALKQWLDDGYRFLRVQVPASALSGGAVRLGGLGYRRLRPPDGRLTLPLSAALSLAADEGAESAADPLPTLLHVVADQRYRVENHAAIALPELAEEIAASEAAGGGFDWAPTLDEVTGLAGGRLFVTGLAGELEDAWEGGDAYVTRLEARPPLATLADPVTVFAQEGLDVDSVAIVLLSPEGTLAGLGLGLLWLLGLRHRSRKRTLPG